MKAHEASAVVAAKVDELVAAEQSDWQHDIIALLDDVEVDTLRMSRPGAD